MLGVERAFWWAYEHAPEGMDALAHLGRRYVLPMLRHRLPVRRLTGAATPGHPSVSVITTGAAMTLDVLVNRFFCEPPQVDSLGPVSLARLPAVLEQLAPTADLMLACVPRAFVGWFGPSYLRIPALVGARLPLGASMATTLAHATRTVRYDVRRVLAADHHWTFSRELRDFEHFYDEFYRPFVAARFGPLAVLRERQVLRRQFRQKGGLIWLWRDGQIVGGDLVRENGHRLHALVQAIHPSYSSTFKPSANFALNVALCDVASRQGLTELDLGGSVPSLSDGVFRSKRAWGAIFESYPENYRDILMRWSTPLRPSVQGFLHTTPLIFESPSGLSSLAAGAPHEPVDPELVPHLWHQLMPQGIERLFVVQAAAGAGGSFDARTVDDAIRLDLNADAGAINRAARSLREAPTALKDSQ